MSIIWAATMVTQAPIELTMTLLSPSGDFGFAYVADPIMCAVSVQGGVPDSVELYRSDDFVTWTTLASELALHFGEEWRGTFTLPGVGSFWYRYTATLGGEDFYSAVFVATITPPED